MQGFFIWFKAFFGNMLQGILQVFKGIFFGVIQIFDFSYYFKLWSDNGGSFGVADWIFSILAFILILAVWVGIFFLIGIGIGKIVRFKKSMSSNEDFLEEIAELQRQNARLTAEKERCEAELEDLMARWEEAAQALEQG